MKRTACFLIAFLVSGCSIQDFGSSFKANHYFNQKNFEKGVAEFSNDVNANPNNATAHYYLGRLYLVQDNYRNALVHLREAVAIEPDDPDYRFWLGVAYGESGNPIEEQQQYAYALRQNSSHAQAKLYLAHLLLKQGQYRKALERYDGLLKKYPYNASALYNRALCLKLTNQKSDEKEAWLNYLKYYPSGFLAIKATDNLNKLGDFTYRNHQFGHRTVTLKKITFSRDRLAFDARVSMRLAGAILSNLPKGDLVITVFSESEEEMARQRAINLRAFLLEEYPRLDSNRIKLSWFGSPEKLFWNGRQYINRESTRMYLVGWE